MDQRVLCLWGAIMATMVMANINDDPAGNQIVSFKKRISGPIPIMTTAAGKPIDKYEATLTLNKRLIFNEYFMDTMTHFDRERIPERVVHAKGGGAFGYFEVTHNISDICKAKLFSKTGKKTPVAVRFSPITADKGAPDVTREPRGFAVKFYTEEGNFDIVGLNVPMFAFKDPLIFTGFARALKRNPVTNLVDVNTFWDAFTSHFESLHMLLYVLGDRGIPDGFRHMPGFSIHTFQVANEAGESYFVRFHILPDAGIKSILSEEARTIAFEDPDYAVRDLYNAIAQGNFPSWTISVQVISIIDVLKEGFHFFDVTRTLPEDKYPRRPIGRMVLNRNPENYFAEIEQLAFSPSNLVPGILGAPDKLFEARRLAYRDTQYYRLGANFLKIPVNCPINSMPYTYNRDGVAPVVDNEWDTPNYYPNSFFGPVPYKEENKVELISINEDLPRNLDQIRDLYLSYGPDEMKRLVENILSSLTRATRFLQERAVKLFGFVDADLGKKVWEGIQGNRTQ